MSDDSWSIQLRKGLVELGVLAVLRDGETYGYDIVSRLRRVDGMALTESTVYPVLARLEVGGCVQVRSAPSPSGPPRRYFRLTRAGNERLASLTAQWRQVSAGIAGLLAGGQA
ncbi:MAG: PadR family transcriptional regulator [Planctomycetes bacterium]|nr:PadR family transcriptional regulator [Planctomycetota bacterium]